MYDKLISYKINNIDTSRFALKTKYTVDKSDLETKILYTSWLVKKINHNAKISEIESKIPSISGLAITSALTADENKISDVKNQAIWGRYPHLGGEKVPLTFLGSYTSKY